jgi:hypothetical protein
LELGKVENEHQVQKWVFTLCEFRRYFNYNSLQEIDWCRNVNKYDKFVCNKEDSLDRSYKINLYMKEIRTLEKFNSLHSIMVDFIILLQDNSRIFIGKLKSLEISSWFI